jgi:deoxycytidylate deaminase
MTKSMNRIQNIQRESRRLDREVSSRDRHWYSLAEKTARLSECRYRLGAVIVKGGNVLSIACNILRTHTSHVNWLDWVVSIHAEHRACLLAQCNIVGATIYVARYKGDTSKPCKSCYAAILESGIKEVCYLEQGTLHKARIQ